MRTALACPDPPDHPTVGAHAGHTSGWDTAAAPDIADWPTAAGTPWAHVDHNTPEDRRAHRPR